MDVSEASALSASTVFTKYFGVTKNVLSIDTIINYTELARFARPETVLANVICVLYRQG